MLSTILIGFVVALVIYKLFSSTRRPKDFPPGFQIWPVIGNMHQLGMEYHKVAMNQIKEFGDIQGYKMGSNWVVFLNNADDMRETFARPEFSSRGGYNVFLDGQTAENNYGLIMSFGQKWQQHRRFSLKTLRDFGFAKQGGEGIIMEEVRELKERFRKDVGKPFDNVRVFNVAVFNVIWSILAGERYNHDDARVKKYISMLDDFLMKMESGMTMYYWLFPELLKMRAAAPFLFPKGTEGTMMREAVFQFFRETLQQHRETHQEGQPRDFIDAMIDESKKEGNYEEMDFLSTLLDFFLAGSETTSTTMRWTFFIMAQYPEVQEKLAKEILSLASNRDIGLADRPNLPYVDAVTQEIFRVSCLIPGGVEHNTSQAATLKGYTIPKDTLIFFNVYACHFSKDFWGDPENFRPERFLEEGSKIGSRQKNWIPFGVGKRSCLGEALARDEFFLFFTNLVQSFRISFPEGEPKHSMTGVSNAGIQSPENHRIVLQERN